MAPDPPAPAGRPGSRVLDTDHALRVTQLSARELYYACDRGWIGPKVPRVPYEPLAWSVTDVEHARVFACLRRAGLEGPAAARTATAALAGTTREVDGAVVLAPGVWVHVVPADLSPTPAPPRPQSRRDVPARPRRPSERL